MMKHRIPDYIFGNDFFSNLRMVIRKRFYRGYGYNVKSTYKMMIAVKPKNHEDFRYIQTS